VHHLRVALAQLNTTVGDFDGNQTLILDAARRAAEFEVDLVVTPELAMTGYPPEDLLIRGDFIDEARERLLILAEETRGLPPLVVGCLDFEDHLYNSAAVLHDGQVVGMYHKQMLPNYGVFDEERYFHPGHEVHLFEIGGVPVGVTVCEDMWFPGGPAREQALAGAQVIVNLNASPFHADKSRYRERMISARAADNTVAVVYVNQIGGQDELIFDGNSLVVDAEGATIARGASMKEDLLIADIPIDEIVQHQLHESRLRRARLPEHRVQPIAVTAPFDGDRVELPERSLEPPDAVAEVYDALVLGTGDYVRKSGFESVFVAMSGGIDSAIVGAIAVDALGPEHVIGVSMPSRYSSEGSIADAVDLAERLGVRLASLPIEPIHDAALDTLTREFEGLEPGTAEENLQSRIRGMLVMALSNKQAGSLVLTTGNKSEYACGYATLYGDMVGGFAVIKDVAKTMVWELARYRNTLSEVIPVNSIEKPPSAELRPDQLDTDSLPEYDILDPIVEAYVEDDLPLESIVARGFEEATVRRIIDMINRNEYKRRQSPPGVKISTRAFGRDRRLPMATKYRGY
jgi:NAD+ synthase (glutamine-hydrolysing)